MQKTKHTQNLFVKSYLWTSRSPLLFVICHVNPLFGSKPGWEISRPCFFTSFMYLKNIIKMMSLQMRKKEKETEASVKVK